MDRQTLIEETLEKLNELTDADGGPCWLKLDEARVVLEAFAATLLGAQVCGCGHLVGDHHGGYDGKACTGLDCPCSRWGVSAGVTGAPRPDGGPR